MKEKRNLLVSLILGVTIGWALGFLRLPFVEKNDSFWIGFLCSAAIFALIVLWLFIWNKNRDLHHLIGKQQPSSDAKSIAKTQFSITSVLSLVLLLGGLICGLLVYKQNKSFDRQSQSLKAQLEEQAVSLKTIKHNNFVMGMGVFWSNIESELKSNPNRSLTETSIARISELSHSFEPIKYYTEDSLFMRMISFERGQLLLGLSNLKMDSSSFNKIKQQATFLGADLKEATLNNLDLSGIDLRKAHLWGASLQRTNLKEANLKGADLSWANLNAADLQLANLNGVNLKQANLTQSRLNEAKLQYTDMKGVLLNQADLTKCDLFGASLIKVNFTKTNLTASNLLQAHVEEDWIEKSDNWQIIGLEKIKETYHATIDRSRHLKQHIFRLRKK